jgi:Acyl-CoA reductase (LuxC)
MQLQKRIESFVALGKNLSDNTTEWQQAKQTAEYKNGWFTQDFIELASSNIIRYFLQEDILQSFAKQYNTTEDYSSKTVGLVMAGNIPMVGFHDMLCVLISGHHVLIKLSSKDEVLLTYIIDFLKQYHTDWNDKIGVSEMLKNCDAYIATGSNNASLAFTYYFAKWPNIIRKNRTSVAIITGQETEKELQQLADDVHLYFGLGCRNVTKIYVPNEYNFEKMIAAFAGYQAQSNHHKYKNNYDYNLALYLLNNQYYMTNGAVLLIENTTLFSPISTLHYEYYADIQMVENNLIKNQEVQCIVGQHFTPFGQSQQPSITDFADGVDTMEFLKNL